MTHHTSQPQLNRGAGDAWEGEAAGRRHQEMTHHVSQPQLDWGAGDARGGEPARQQMTKQGMTHRDPQPQLDWRAEGGWGPALEDDWAAAEDWSQQEVHLWPGNQTPPPQRQPPAFEAPSQLDAAAQQQPAGQVDGWWEQQWPDSSWDNVQRQDSAWEEEQWQEFPIWEDEWQLERKASRERLWDQPGHRCKPPRLVVTLTPCDDSEEPQPSFAAARTQRWLDGSVAHSSRVRNTLPAPPAPRSSRLPQIAAPDESACSQTAPKHWPSLKEAAEMRAASSSQGPETQAVKSYKEALSPPGDAAAAKPEPQKSVADGWETPQRQPVKMRQNQPWEQALRQLEPKPMEPSSRPRAAPRIR